MNRDDEVRFGLWYDFRNPAPWDRPFTDLYADILEQIAWAEELGYRSVWLTEHHFTADGYSPSPLVIGGAIAARTREMMLSTSLMLLPLHDPVRLAEDAATLAIVSGGRFNLGVGMGYRAVEFEAFHRELRHRPSLMEESVELLRRAWSGQSLAFRGRRFELPDIRVTPRPEHPPLLLMGGESEVAIDRAARLGDGYLSNSDTQLPIYLEALSRHGKDPALGRIHAGQFVIIDEDPEATWARIGDHALYQLNEYISWGAFNGMMAPFPDRDALVDAGIFRLWDGATAVSELVRLLRAFPQIKDLIFWAQLPGEPVESGSKRLEYFSHHVAPEIRDSLADRPRVGT